MPDLDLVNLMTARKNKLSKTLDDIRTCIDDRRIWKFKAYNK